MGQASEEINLRGFFVACGASRGVATYRKSEYGVSRLITTLRMPEKAINLVVYVELWINIIELFGMIFIFYFHIDNLTLVLFFIIDKYISENFQNGTHK